MVIGKTSGRGKRRRSREYKQEKDGGGIDDDVDSIIRVFANHLLEETFEDISEPFWGPPGRTCGDSRALSGEFLGSSWEPWGPSGAILEDIGQDGEVP